MNRNYIELRSHRSMGPPSPQEMPPVHSFGRSCCLPGIDPTTLTFWFLGSLWLLTPIHGHSKITWLYFQPLPDLLTVIQKAWEFPYRMKQRCGFNSKRRQEEGADSDSLTIGCRWGSHLRNWPGQIPPPLVIGSAWDI